MVKVPVIPRNFFFRDPHFRSTWDQFEDLHRAMARESEQFWQHLERQMVSMEPKDREKEQLQVDQQEKQAQQQDQGKQLKEKDDEYSPWFFPRRWMLPSLFDIPIFDEKMRSLDLFQGEHSEQIRMTDDNDKFEVSLALHDFKPEEVKVSVKDNMLSIEAEKDEKSEGHYKKVQYCRQYALPPNCITEEIKANASSDGVFVVTAPKRQNAVKGSVRAIPIEKK